jgi:hypothetical protein
MAIGSVLERPVDFAAMGKQGGGGSADQSSSSSKSYFTQHA